MQGYVPGQDGAFGESRKCFAELGGGNPLEVWTLPVSGFV